MFRIEQVMVATGADSPSNARRSEMRKVVVYSNDCRLTGAPWKSATPQAWKLLCKNHQKLDNAHPHPGPLARGEGERFARFSKNVALQFHPFVFAKMVSTKQLGNPRCNNGG